MKNRIEYTGHIHESGEDYLEKILMLQEQDKNVRSVDLAAAFGYSRPAISRAVKVLKEDGFILVGNKGQLELTEEGRKKAEETLARHRVLTKLFKKLGIDSDIAETDACRVGHIIHQETFAKLAELADKGEIEFFQGDWLQGVMEAIL